MKMEHLLAQLDGVCEYAAKGDLDYKGFLTHSTAPKRAVFQIVLKHRPHLLRTISD
jgi:hypothetical protein